MWTFMAALALAGASGPSAPTLFGLEFGKPVSLPTCPRARLPGGGVSEFLYEQRPSQTCHEPEIQLRDAPWRRGSINFPLNAVPLIMRGNTGFTLIVGGKLEGIDIDTLSHNNTNAIIRELTGKFGKPTSVIRDKAVVAGIALPSVVATWRLPAITVTYTNINDDLDAGRLLVETPVMQRLRRQNELAAERARTPL
ncbi:MAG: hypothetical protein M3Q19_00750 [Pseudomonadota bacterium]|nr:hypothetical protein [Pseudomonadota bacterium]